MSPSEYRFCPLCGAPLPPAAKPACKGVSCNFVHHDNPTPVVAALLELPGGVVLVRNKGWPEKMFGLPTGFLEAREDPADAVVREVQEELGLTASVVGLVGVYPFPLQNQVILAYHLRAEGNVQRGEELEDHRVVPVDKLRPWPFATGLAVEAWLAARLRARCASPGP
ncbi:MAG: hydrolase [Pseudomonadota bacterium]|jgi:NADH pyrophosphatase NudC (nudix superfamily)